MSPCEYLGLKFGSTRSGLGHVRPKSYMSKIKRGKGQKKKFMILERILSEKGNIDVGIENHIPIRGIIHKLFTNTFPIYFLSRIPYFKILLCDFDNVKY